MPPLVLGVVLCLVVGIAGAMAWLMASRYRLAADVERFAGFMEHGPFVAFMKDANGRYIYENRALVDLVGRIRPGTTTILGRTDREVFASSDGAAYEAHDRRVITHGKPMQFDEVSVGADGTVRHWSTIKFPRLDSRRRPCVAGIAIEVTALRQARTDARTSEDRCALALEAGQMGDFALDLSTQTLDTSRLFAVLHGRPETKTRLSLEESLAEVHADDRPKIVEAVQAALNGRPPQRITYRVRLPDGDIRWIELTGKMFTDPAGRPSVVRGVGFDVTEHVKAYEEIARQRAILRRLIEVQEKERQALCHELHDGLMQFAIGAKMQLESLGQEDDAAVRDSRINAAANSLARGIAEGRNLIRGVRPAVLDDLGLSAAITELAELMVGAGITVETILEEGIDTLPPALCTTVYRVVQESLNNVRKHAEAKRATVDIRRVAGEVHVRVQDDGSGVDVDKARSEGFGLVGMAERVRLVGGTFGIESRKGSGTEIVVHLPIPGAGLDAEGMEGKSSRFPLAPHAGPLAKH